MLILGMLTAGTPGLAQFSVELVVGGLNQPVYMTQAPGDDVNLFIVERADPGNAVGRILQYNQQTETKSTFLDLSGTISSDGGALSLAFHPDYQTNSKFYVSLNDNRVNRVEEWQLIGGVPTLQRTLLQYDNLVNNYHTVNWLGFRPNGNSNELFVTAGDGGTQANQGAFDPALIESPDSPYGKLMRIDLNADFTAGPAGDPTHSGIDVMALGLRNPYRASFDRQTGAMYVGDVGFNSAEEVNFVPASHFSNPLTAPLDFGWTDREGTIETVAINAGGPGSPGDLEPIFDYAHSGQPLPHESVIHGGSVTGGYLYRGPVPQLQGRYFFGDFVTQDIYSGAFNPETSPAAYDGTIITDIQNHTALFENASQLDSPDIWVTSFAEDNAGNLYVVDFGEGFFPPLGEGELYRIVPLSDVTLVVDRDTGEMALTNLTGSDTAIQSYEISSSIGGLDPTALTPIAGNYDASMSGNGSVDTNDPWQILSNDSDHYSFEEATTGDAGILPMGVDIVLSGGGGWIPSPAEDLEITLTLEGGTMVAGQVVFVGNGAAPFPPGDLNFDGKTDELDWPAFRDNHGRSFNELSAAQSYALGDLDGDGDNDYEDFLRFQADFDRANGAGALANLANIPEPSTGLLLLLGTAAISVVGRKTLSC